MTTEKSVTPSVSSPDTPAASPKSGKPLSPNTTHKGSDQLLTQYAPIVGGALLVLLLGIGGYFFYESYSKKQQEKSLTLIYEFKNGPWKNFQAKKLTEEEFFKEWGTLSEKVGAQKAFAAWTLEVIKPFMQEGKWEKAIQILSPVVDRFRNDPYLFYFLGTPLAAVYEDSGDRKKAIEILEEILSRNVKFLEAKIYFDLGRLYQGEGQKDKAKMNYQYVVDNYPDDKLANLARIHLKQLQ